jgi:8-oxo-dGTP diphosphatase
MIHLIRHAHAGSRAAWEGDDRLRPLSARGTREAAAIADALGAGFEIPAVLSSPYTRCVETVVPLASRVGIVPEAVDWLAEGEPAHAALERIPGLAPGTVLCSHGDVVGGIVERLAASGVPLDGPPAWPKGSIWHLEIAGGRVRAAAYRRPGDEDVTGR